MASLGWTWEQVDDLTLPRLTALTTYWKKHPPVHILVAAFVGYKTPHEAQGTELTMEEFLALGRRV